MRRFSRSALVVVTAGCCSLGCGNGKIGVEHQRGVPNGPPVETVLDSTTGTTTELYPDGTVVVKQPDGTMTVTTRDGASTTYNPDGTMASNQESAGAGALEGTRPSPDNGATTRLDQALPPSMDASFDREASLAAFQDSVRALLQTNCGSCHGGATQNQLPLLGDGDAATAHEAALGYVNLRQVDMARLISRLAIDGHNCWSDCSKNALSMKAELEHWADLLANLGKLPAIDVPILPAEVSESMVLEWIASDQSALAAEARPYARYASLHVLYNEGASPDDLNTARAGLSKALNSTARYAPAIVNPIPIDEYSLVYRFDVRDYWGYARTLLAFGSVSGPCLSAGALTGDQVEERPDCGLEIWQRIARGNVDVSEDDTTWASQGSPSNTEGFHPEYVEAAQLVYTLSRPDVYNAIMQLPNVATVLERELGVDNTTTYQYMTVNDALTIGERLMWRTPIPDGYYWKTVDQFSTVDFVFYERPIPVFTAEDRSQIITTPVIVSAESEVSTPNVYTGDTGAQAQSSEVIFSLPNGLQGYALYGAGNQRRNDVYTFVVVDPRRIGEEPGVPPAVDPRFNFSGVRLLNGASCMGCHSGGPNRAPDDMRSYIAANPEGIWTAFASANEVEALYAGTSVMRAVIENDRTFFQNAQQAIANAMILGTDDKTLYYEPTLYLFESAQRLYGYINTISN